MLSTGSPHGTYLSDNFGINEDTLTINDVKQLYLAAYGLHAKSRFSFIPFSKREVRVLLHSAGKVHPGNMEYQIAMDALSVANDLMDFVLMYAGRITEKTSRSLEANRHILASYMTSLSGPQTLEHLNRMVRRSYAGMTDIDTDIISKVLPVFTSIFCDRC
ncbi:Hypothetical protein FKW44_022688 [Caligus rogercresseyi]|uniref:Uncharacterized protein n=1 Tax=Caligus rogercresseyi TaxID=217165 RepID=A0A7T8GNT0_CALRO|nr:Hypothetical protein FKW44_022688 [Caligus rogercresseyi]